MALLMLSSGLGLPGPGDIVVEQHLHSDVTELFQVRSQGVNQVVGRLGLLIGRCGLRIKNVKADVTLDHLRHESVHGTSASGDVMQHLGAFGFLVDGSFDGLNLASNSSYPIEQFLFLFCRVSHKKPGSGLDKNTPPGIA